MNSAKQVALIVGGSGGIGRAVASLLGKNNFEVVLAGRSKDSLTKISAETGFQYLVMDVTDSGHVKSGFANLMAQFNRLDLLVNAAGRHTKMTPILRMKENDWHIQNNLHSLGCFLIGQQAFKIMRKQRGGSIINIASIAAKTPLVTGYAGYAAAKAAMVNFTKSLNQEGNRYGIRATTLSPTYVDTALWEGVDMDPKRMMAPGVIAETIFYLTRLPSNVVIQEIALDTILTHK